MNQIVELIRKQEEELQKKKKREQKEIKKTGSKGGETEKSEKESEPPSGQKQKTTDYQEPPAKRPRFNSSVSIKSLKSDSNKKQVNLAEPPEQSDPPPKVSKSTGSKSVKKAVE